MSPPTAEAPTIGIEEEFFLVDPGSGELRSVSGAVLDHLHGTVGERVHHELQRSQVETETAVCPTLDELRRELVAMRRRLNEAAAASGVALASCGTHPSADWERAERTPQEAYQRLERDYQQLAREQLVCGCHVHVGVAGVEQALSALNRARLWAAPILALAVNSPFWGGVDTGYASYRTGLWHRWPVSGLPEAFDSAADYDALVDRLKRTGSIDDPARIYWDIRPSARYPTLEFRISDACLGVDEVVMVAALARALVQRSLEEEMAGEPLPRPRPELVRAATWRAARYGVEADLLAPSLDEALPARDVIGAFLDHVRPALSASGDWEEVSALVARILDTGTGASRQREVYARTGDLADVIAFVVDQTAAG